MSDPRRTQMEWFLLAQNEAKEPYLSVEMGTKTRSNFRSCRIQILWMKSIGKANKSISKFTPTSYSISDQLNNLYIFCGCCSSHLVSPSGNCGRCWPWPMMFRSPWVRWVRGLPSNPICWSRWWRPIWISVETSRRLSETGRPAGDRDNRGDRRGSFHLFCLVLFFFFFVKSERQRNCVYIYKWNKQKNTWIKEWYRSKTHYWVNKIYV